MAMAAVKTTIQLFGSSIPHRLQQSRGVYVDCKGLNFEQAMGRYGRKMRQDRTLNDLLKKEYYIKPSEERRLREKERVKREKKKLFRAKLKFVLSLRARGL